jgi:hypothetical protein
MDLNEDTQRTVPGMAPLPRHVLPDHGLVFDTFLKHEKVG